MNKLPSWRFWLPLFFQTILILIAPIQVIYTQEVVGSGQSAVENEKVSKQR